MLIGRFGFQDNGEIKGEDEMLQPQDSATVSALSFYVYFPSLKRN
jgi:hypothetical protein